MNVRWFWLIILPLPMQADLEKSHHQRVSELQRLRSMYALLLLQLLVVFRFFVVLCQYLWTLKDFIISLKMSFKDVVGRTYKLDYLFRKILTWHVIRFNNHFVTLFLVKQHSYLFLAYFFNPVSFGRVFSRRSL